jgi:hypothetical protein
VARLRRRESAPPVGPVDVAWRWRWLRRATTMGSVDERVAIVEAALAAQGTLEAARRRMGVDWRCWGVRRGAA